MSEQDSNRLIQYSPNDMSQYQENLIDQGNFARAASDLRSWLQVHPEDPGQIRRLELSRALFYNGRVTEAHDQAEKMLQSNLHETYGLSFLGRTEARLGNFSRARSLFEQALQENPDNHEAQRFLYGDTDLQTQEVLQILEKDVITPRDKITAAELCQAISFRAEQPLKFDPIEMRPTMKEEIREKLEECRVIQQEAVDDMSAQEIADRQSYHSTREDYKKAELVLRRWLEHNGDDPQANVRRLELGRVLLHQNETTRARREVERVLLSNPNDNWALSLLGQIEAKWGDQAKAQTLYERALAVNPHNHEARTLHETIEQAATEEHIRQSIEAGVNVYNKLIKRQDLLRGADPNITFHGEENYSEFQINVPMPDGQRKKLEIRATKEREFQIESYYYPQRGSSRCEVYEIKRRENWKSAGHNYTLWPDSNFDRAKSPQFYADMAFLQALDKKLQ